MKQLEQAWAQWLAAIRARDIKAKKRWAAEIERLVDVVAIKNHGGRIPWS